MLSVEIRVNGVIVSAMDAVNVGLNDPSGCYKYDYRLVKFPVDHKKKLIAKNGSVLHDRDDGIEALVGQILRKCVE
jgi:hypothetical protein